MTSINITSGSWVGTTYDVDSDDGDTIIYLHDGTNRIKYVRSEFTWYDDNTDQPYVLAEWAGSNGNSYIAGQVSVYNPVQLIGFASNYSQVRFVFTNPHWQQTPLAPNTNSVSDAFVSYVVEDNELRVYIPLDKPSTVGTDIYYQLRKVSGTSFFVRIVHTQGTPTNETIVPTTAGIYQLEKVQSSPYISTTYDTAEVSQAQLDFYAANNPPDDDPPDDDPPENDPPSTPVFVPPVFIRGSGVRGNLNFW